MIQSEDQLIALCAAGREKTSPRIVEIYDEYGRGEQAADYRVMRYRELRDDNGAPPVWWSPLPATSRKAGTCWRTTR